MRTSRKGFTLVEIMIVVAIIGILIAIAVPGFIKARKEARKRACQENLQKVDGAKTQWAMDTNADETVAPTWADLVTAGRTGYLQVIPACPASGVYSILAISTAPTCTKSTDGHVLPQ